jgi:hypothetical protein
VTSGAETASFDFDGHTLVLDDGFVLRHGLLSNDGSLAIIELACISPYDGSTATATIRYRHKTGAIEADGLDAVHALMGASRSMAVLYGALPLLVSRTRAQAGPEISDADLWPSACDLAQLQLAGAEAGVTLACGPSGFDLSLECSGHSSSMHCDSSRPGLRQQLPHSAAIGDRANDSVTRRSGN